MNIKNEELKELLLKESYVSQDDLKNADEYLKSERGTLSDFLINEGLLTKQLLGQAISEYLGVPFADLVANPPSKEQVLQVPMEVAQKYNLVFYSEDAKQVTVATDDPKNKDLDGVLKKIFPKKKVVIALSFIDDIHALFIYYRKPLETRFSEIIAAQKRIAPEIFDTILDDAMAFHASDMHFEPYENKVTVRFRIDGILHDAGSIPKEYYENVLNWVKVQSKMRIDEHRVPQDGSMRVVKDEKPIDMRISIAPIIDGENIVIRILTAYVKSFALEDLGLSDADAKTIMETSKMPYGMFLTTGPTGSGKTTTLYALIKILNKPNLNITTIEDPIEYKIPGINQIQVSPDKGLTFADGLRSIVRQDPNVILVGEIRDQETADIAVNAALTGHLLFSTFHANDAATSIPRLLDMGIEPFVLSSTLKVIAAQRLVRQICTHCKYSKSVKIEELEKVLPDARNYFDAKDTLLYLGKGCTICSNTGYKERIAIFEFIKVSSALQTVILKRPSGQEIWEIAKKEGAKSLFEDGIDKVKKGITTIEELLRVCTPQQWIKTPEQEKEAKARDVKKVKMEKAENKKNELKREKKSTAKNLKKTSPKTKK